MRNAHMKCLAVTLGILMTPIAMMPLPSMAQDMPPIQSMVHRAYISSELSPVRLAGEEVFSVTADAGGFTAEERSVIIEKNLNNALMAAKSISPDIVEIVYVNNLPVIRIGGKHVVTIDSSLAKMHGTTMDELAQKWALSMKTVLGDTARVENYLAQLDGDFLLGPDSPPYRRARWEAARLNRSADEYRKALPRDLVCSDSFEDRGFEFLLKRDAKSAEKMFCQALNLDRGNERAHYGLGVALLKQGKVDQAIKSLETARWLDPDDAQVHLALGQALETKGHDREAIKRYKEAGLLQPANPESVLYIADLREEQNDISKSVAELTDALENRPESQYVRLRRKDQISWRLTKPY